MNYILELYDMPGGIGKTAIEGILKKLSPLKPVRVPQAVKLMRHSQSELQILQAVRRKSGDEALAMAIDDTRNGSKKSKRAVHEMIGKLRKAYSTARTNEEKQKLHEAIQLLYRQARKNTHGKILTATLKPFSHKGKQSRLYTGTKIADMLREADEEIGYDEFDEEWDEN